MAEDVAAIILAGGSGSRVQKEINKVYLPIGEREMLEFCLETMDRSPQIDRIVLVVRDEDRPHAELLIGETMPAKLTDVVVGGPSRHESEYAGLTALIDAIEAGDSQAVVHLIVEHWELSRDLLDYYVKPDPLAFEMAAESA